MSRIKKLFVLILVVSLILSLAASAATAGIGSGVVTSSALRLRKEPSSDAETLALVGEGTKVEILEDAIDGWYKVSYNNLTGYMAAEHIAATFTATEDDTAENSNTDIIVVIGYAMTTSSLRLRDTPSPSGTILTTVSQDTMVELLSDQVDGWFKVCYEDIVGYMSAEYLMVIELVSPEEVNPPESDSSDKEETELPEGSSEGESKDETNDDDESDSSGDNSGSEDSEDTPGESEDTGNSEGNSESEDNNGASSEEGNTEEESPEGGSTEEEPPVEEEPTLGEQLLRIGIYYGTAGKATVDLFLTTGNGYHFGYYDSSNDNQFVVLGSTTTKNITVTSKSNTMVVTSTSGGAELFRHNMSCGTQLGILPYSDSGEKTLTKCGYNYYGGFRFERIAAYDNTMTIVNMVPLDDYTKGVVPYEMSASWHIEALKVQTICARTFALSHTGKHKKTFSFDLCDSDCCQVYKGLYAKSNADAVNYAVDSTSGYVLMYNGKYCDTVYSSSNGGASESAKNVWGKDIAYLQGIYDPYEALISDRISKYEWEFSFTSKELQDKLVAAGYTSCGLIKEVETTLSDTGNVITLTFIDEKDKSFSLYNGSKCRTFLSLRSIRYTVTSENGNEATDGYVTVNESESVDMSQGIAVMGADGTISYITSGYILTAEGTEEISTTASNKAEGTIFTFSGTGWGHNVGMSQYGAYAMAEQGFTFDQILQFYYSGAEVVFCD